MNEFNKTVSEIFTVPMPKDKKAERLTPAAQKVFDNYRKAYRLKFFAIPEIVEYDAINKMIRLTTLPQAVSVKRLRELARMMK